MAEESANLNPNPNLNPNVNTNPNPNSNLNSNPSEGKAALEEIQRLAEESAKMEEKYLEEQRSLIIKWQEGLLGSGLGLGLRLGPGLGLRSGPGLRLGLRLGFSRLRWRRSTSSNNAR